VNEAAYEEQNLVTVSRDLTRVNGIKMIYFAFADWYCRTTKLNNTRPASVGFGRYAHRAGYFFRGTESYEIR